jgi:TonB family protein
MPAIHQTGVFYAQHGVAAQTVGSFPKELRSKLLSNLEPRFVGLFAGSFLLFGIFVFSLSFIKPSETVSQKQILKIQERYASIVLNQPKPEPVVEEKGAQKGTEAGSKTGGEKGEGKVDRAKESIADKKSRQEGGKVSRAAARAAIGKQIASSGIFAAITAAGGSGGNGATGEDGAADLLGAAGNALGDLEGISIARGSFATAKSGDGSGTGGPGGAGLGPRGSRASGGDIERAAIGKTTGTQLASAGEVNITSAPPEVSGDAASSAERSMEAIQSVVNRAKGQIKRVYETWLKRDPELKGNIKVKFTILPSGVVSNATIINSTMNNPEFEQNIIRYIQRWQFQPIAGGGGGPVEVIFPFAFEGQE